MILFLYGQEQFNLKQKLRQLKAKFISASLGDTNLSVLDAQKTTVKEINAQIMAMPFLSNSRLVIIENILNLGKKELQEQMGELLLKVPKSTVLVFVEEGKIDKRLALFKKLLKSEKVQEFKMLSESELEDWVKSTVLEKNGQINQAAVKKLIIFCGNDLFRLNNEIDKLLAFNNQISEESIKLLVSEQIESNIFTLTDAISSKNRKIALGELKKLILNGEAELKIFAMIVTTFRNLLIVKDLIERNYKSSFQIAKIASIHPYVAQKITESCQKFQISQLKSHYQTLLQYDYKMKTGKLEPRIALDLLLLTVCK